MTRDDIDTKYLNDMDNAHEAFVDAYYESMGDYAYADSVRKRTERKAEHDYQHVITEVKKERK